MEKFRIVTLVIALFVGLTLLSACDKSPAPAPKATTPPPAAAPAAPAAAPAEAPAAAPADHAAAPAALPAECESYLSQINECVNKLSKDAAASDAMKQQMDQARTQLSQIQDKAVLSVSCKQAAEAFSEYAKKAGC
ncbi:MAG: DUF5339 family protein [Burkholderiales bacterium]|jgi:hypothetical protein|nr:DUF5339 family protein [Burkholderiales bacterium]